jgi:hypothetical protein
MATVTIRLSDSETEIGKVLAHFESDPPYVDDTMELTNAQLMAVEFAQTLQRGDDDDGLVDTDI